MAEMGSIVHNEARRPRPSEVLFMGDSLTAHFAGLSSPSCKTRKCVPRPPSGRSRVTRDVDVKGFDVDVKGRDVDVKGCVIVKAPS
eukprot:8307777-Pyramimonas_sp.AAC.1